MKDRRKQREPETQRLTSDSGGERHRCRRAKAQTFLSFDHKHFPFLHSRKAAGQEAELGHFQASSRYTQAIKSVFQAYHQGAPGWGQGCGMACEECMGGGWWGVRCKLSLSPCTPQVSQHCNMQLPFLVPTSIPTPFPQHCLLPLITEPGPRLPSPPRSRNMGPSWPTQCWSFTQ